MTDLDVFLPYIMPYAPGCSEPLAKQALIVAAKEFCQRTRLWRSEDSFTLSSSCNIVCTPDHAELYEIEYAALDGRALDPIGYAELNREFPNWKTSEGLGKWISQVEPDSVIVAPAVTTGTLSLNLILTPAEDADQLPDFLGNHYRQIIAWGALREILLTPNQSFTSPDGAALYGARFEQKVDSLFHRNIVGQQRAPARTRAQFM